MRYCCATIRKFFCSRSLRSVDLRSHAKVCTFCGLASSATIFVCVQLAALVYLRLVLKVAVEKQPKVSIICLTTIYHCK